MRLDSFFWALCMAIVVKTASAKSQLTLTELLEEIPNCALECLLDYIPSSTCGISNLTCICTNIPLQSNLSVCIQKSCNFTEQIEVAEVNEANCAGIPVDFRGWQVIIVGLVFGIITLATVLLRCYSRYLIAQSFWWDDWGILAALALLIATILVATFNCLLGYGRHFWDIEPTKIVALLKLFWTGEILYNATLTTTRLSILLFYLRIFQIPWFRKLTFGVILFTILSGAAFNFVIVFQCKPVSGAWDWTIPRSQCIDLNALAFANAGIGITQDVVILFMPIPNLLSLQMSGIKKLHLVFLFSLGALAVITSMVRLKFIVDFGDSVDPTWDNIIPSTWSILEISIAMICTCLPSIRALIHRWFPSTFSYSTYPGHDVYRGNASRSWDVSRDIKLSSHTGNYSSQIKSNKDKSILRIVTREDVLSSTEDIICRSISDNKNSGHINKDPKRSDEIMFFHVSQDADPLTKLDQNHISKQVIVTVNSSTLVPNGRGGN